MKIVVGILNKKKSRKNMLRNRARDVSLNDDYARE